MRIIRWQIKLILKGSRSQNRLGLKIFQSRVLHTQECLHRLLRCRNRCRLHRNISNNLRRTKLLFRSGLCQYKTNYLKIWDKSSLRQSSKFKTIIGDPWGLKIYKETTHWSHWATNILNQVQATLISRWVAWLLALKIEISFKWNSACLWNFRQLEKRIRRRNHNLRYEKGRCQFRIILQ